MTLLLHVCCADCLLRFLVALGYPLPAPAHPLVQNYSRFSPSTSSSLPAIQLYFFNPNLCPKSEYNSRLQAVQQLAHLLRLPLTVADYKPQAYFTLPPVQAQLSTLQLQPGRCAACQALRLRHTLTQLATLTARATTTPTVTTSGPSASSPALFSTTMLASSYLDHQQIISLAMGLSPTQFFLPTFTRHPATIKTSGFYKQNYCGCLFSLLQKSQCKFLIPK